jgi:putative protein-disulfide isomerase
MNSLLYIADPLCSWCYGFGPQIDLLRTRFADVPLNLMMGGLRAYNTQVMDDSLKEYLRTAWLRVGEASGQPFSDAALARKGFVYDTEPPCRAVVTARTLQPQLAWPLMKAVQRGFYALGKDVTQPEVLADIAQETGFDRATFLQALTSREMQDEAANDFASVKQLGISGFPALLAVRDQHAAMVANGFMHAEAITPRLETFFSGKS